MRFLQKATAALTLSCLLLPTPVGLAESLPVADTAPSLYRSQVIVNGTATQPQAQPIIGSEIFLPLRWTMNQLEVDDILWKPDETTSRQATISLEAPSYFVLKQYQSLLDGLALDSDDLKHTLPLQMYRITLPASPLQSASAVVRTPKHLLLNITNGEITHELPVYDYLLIEGQYYLSSYWFNQLFGANILEDSAKDTVTITAPSTDHWLQALDNLQQQLICTEPKEAIDLWIRAQQKCSGALQYTLLSAELQQTAYSNAVAKGTWTTGASSTAFSDAVITDTQQIDVNTVVYDLQITETLSGQPNKTLHQQITVKRQIGKWQIVAVTGDIDYYTLLGELSPN